MTEQERATCDRCGNQLALGMAMITMLTIQGKTEWKICGACQDQLRKWLRDQRSRLNRPT